MESLVNFDPVGVQRVCGCSPNPSALQTAARKNPSEVRGA